MERLEKCMFYSPDTERNEEEKDTGGKNDL